jgi:cell division septation protein DedD
MREFNLASTSPDPEAGESDSTLDQAEGRPPGGRGKRSRLLVIVGAFVIVAGGGYLALTQFSQYLAPKPTPPARPIRPIAKAPAPSAGPPSAGAPAPAKQAQAGQVPPAPAAPPEAPVKAGPPAAPPAKTAEPQKAAPPSAPGPVAERPEPAPPAKAEAKGPAPAKAEPAKIAKAAPAEPAAALAPPPVRPAQAEAAPAAGSFSLQVGAMINESNAQKLKQRLEQLGYAPVIRKGTVHLRRHVVTTGDYGDRGAAEEAAKRLAAQGIAARVAAAGGRFSLEAGSFANEDDAIDLARQLQQSNYPPRIQDQAQNATVYQVRVGSFPSKAEAQAKGSELKGKGFPYLVVKN